MRFFEVDSAVDAVMGAATIAQQKASAMGKQGQLSMNGFLQMLANTGIVMDYEGFKSVFDTNPQLKNVIAKFDKDTITFASDADEEQAGYEEPQTDMPDDERVAKMAKRATKTREDVNEEQLEGITEGYDFAAEIEQIVDDIREEGITDVNEIFSVIRRYVDDDDAIDDIYQEVLDRIGFTERKLTKAEKAKLRDYEEEIPDKSFKDRYGERWKEVKYATMTKMAKRNA